LHKTLTEELGNSGTFHVRSYVERMKLDIERVKIETISK